MPGVKVLESSGILYRRWPATRAKAVLLLVHGLGAHSARWNFLADYFVKNGIGSYAIELRGFGETKEAPRGHIDSFKTYYRDILNLLAHIKWENPGKKIYLLGESMGGLSAFVLAAMYPKDFSGQILMSPAFANGMKFPLPTYFTVFSSLLYNPKKQVMVPFTSAMITRDEKERRFLEADPRELRLASSKMLLNILLEQMRAQRLIKKIKIPTLFLISGKDLLVDERAGRKVFGRLELVDKKIIEYPESYHALSIEIDRENIFSDILSWLKERI